MSTARELLQILSEKLVDNPRSVIVTELRYNNTLILKLSVHPSDIRLIIGKNGRIIKSIRLLMEKIAKKNRVGIKLQLL